MTAWNLSCPDWRQRLREGRSLVPDLPIDRVAGERAVAVFNKLRLFDVPGTPTMADAGADWFRDIVRALFGSIDPATKRRMIRELFLLVPKKQNKTTGGALLMLTALLLNERPRAPFLLTGPVQKTADDAFAAAAGAIELDPVLAKKLHVRDHLKTIIHRDTQAKLEIMTFDPDIVTGKKVVGALVDEEHVLGRMPRAKKAMVQLRGGMMPFPESFLAIITTQSDEPPAGVFREDLTKAREIRDGERSGAMLPVLYEFPPEMQQDPAKPWRDPVNWPMVTPNLGRSIALETLKQAFDDEDANGDAALRVWASQHLNVQIGMAMHADRWAGADYWERQTDKSITLDSLLKRCEVIAVGIDGGGNDDLYGLNALGKEKRTGDLLSWSRAYALPIVLERRKDIATQLQDFAKQGDLVIVQKIEEACDDVVSIISRIDQAGLLGTLPDERRAIGVDPACIKQTLAALAEAGYPAEQIYGVPQGWRLFSAVKSAELYLSSGVLWHADQPLMTWCVGNAKVQMLRNAAIVTKELSGTAKVDPLMAMFDAVELMGRAPAGSPIDAYMTFLKARQQQEQPDATSTPTELDA